MHRRKKESPFVACLLFPPKASFAEKGFCRDRVLFQMGHHVPTSEMELGQFFSGKSGHWSHHKRLFKRYACDRVRDGCTDKHCRRSIAPCHRQTSQANMHVTQLNTGSFSRCSGAVRDRLRTSYKRSQPMICFRRHLFCCSQDIPASSSRKEGTLMFHSFPISARKAVLVALVIAMLVLATLLLTHHMSHGFSLRLGDLGFWFPTDPIDQFFQFFQYFFPPTPV